jgi:hypothetical protein
MTQSKPSILIAFIAIAVFITAANIGPKGKYKNLQVLPVDISETKLDSIMNSYCKALHVDCEFCHVTTKDPFNFVSPNTDTIDFAKDGKMKDEARKMIRMMIDINKNNFYYDKNIRPEYLNAVSCNTCHRGNAFPLEK